MERISFTEIPQEMMGKLIDLENYINNSEININLLELMRLRVAQINGCAYCVDMHYKELNHLGETDLRLSSLIVWEETNYFTNKERAVLHFAEKLTKLNGKPIADNDYEVIKKHFEKKEIVILTLAIGQINTWTRLMKTFQIEAGNYKVKG
ncbi:carboxymuconolactone decarboxylase family protein [Croceitalea rosinachiae]|uniref:Carboxymuconolactone decarboxylase family protein n=1 Tax=Croceitalea rosinachiae TaxID=3075596 RepID=A0ABU3AA66_9FLAO|nr:carboxymuconolactone decarboxylase family protein [Croceitalea sp. F388]MDT0607069.1 carboxymuconolactone decarboxylase family protein [Croceitalea sp. F388]